MKQLDTSQTKRTKTARFFGGLALGILVLGGGAYGIDYFLSQGSIPRGSTISGVKIGGLERTAALEKLQTELADDVTKQVTLTAGERTATFGAEEAGLSINWEAALDSSGEQPLNPFTRLASFFRDREVPIATDVDQAKLDAVLDRITPELNPEPVNAGIVLIDGNPVVEPQPTNGQKVERAELSAAIIEEWLDPKGPKVDAEIFPPEYGEKQVKPILEGAAKQAVAGPVILHGRNDIAGEIPTARMGEVVTFIPENGEFRVDVNHDNARNILLERLHETERPKRNADISFSGSSRTVTPHVDGVRIDWEKTFENINDRIIGDQPRDFEAIYIDEPATFTTEMAEVATFDQVVGEFTTGGYSEASGVNIARVAQMVNGAIVAPGDTFSLNGFTGPRGAAQGFVESGIILNGRADKAVGGGISQFATTLYNAAYFAGMEDVAHTPHSYYISRYPAGREATVFEGQIDLIFKNTSPHPVRIVTSAGGGNVTVKLMGVKTVQVESISGGRWATTQPHTVNVPGPNCSPSGGAPGFTTSDTRIVRDLSGNEISRKTTTTVYDPSPIVKCS